MSVFGNYPERPVRPYVITGGRTRPSRNTIRPETLLIAAEPPGPLPVSAGSEERALLGMCRQLLSLAEAAAHLRLPVSVAGIVASDLVDSGFLAMQAGDGSGGRPGPDVLQAVLNGLHKLL